MTPEQAQAIYFAGEPAVVTQLCKLGAQVTALHQDPYSTVAAEISL